ncbi:MAG: tRNA 2-thiouridine(34) synthase MnmA [Nitriliruptorales bacterium]|nr:tRNA 2-thiouridine(34) synthase MnmA [Nitriliruptorales bacterium]
MSRVLVALSGGVDSAVAAALLLDQGHDVTGVHLKLADLPLAEQIPGQGCCTLDDAQDARRVAQVLGIDFYVWDLSDVFRSEVQDPFAAGYAVGTTPNPCVTCNERVKYAALLDRARSLGFDALASGHHVRLRRDGQPVIAPGSGVRMFRAVDRRKDQTYVLYMATPEQLAHSLFPVGEMTKDEVRRAASERGLRVADKPDSYDVCFIPDGDTAGYLSSRLPPAPGEIVDLDGTVLGQHDGVWRFTVGQRRGLGLDHHERRFVVQLDATSNRVVVGPREALATHRLEVDAVTWVAGRPPEGPVTIQVRAHGSLHPAELDVGATSMEIRLREPAYGVAAGQAAVVYTPDGEECLGGGRIVAAERVGGRVTAAH